MSSIYWYILSPKVYDVIDGIGISRYMMVHDRHMSLYDEDSVLILVMATNVPGIRTVISGTCLLILRCFFFGCTLLARLNAAHLLRPKGTLGQAQTILFSQVVLVPFPLPPGPPPSFQGERQYPLRPPRLPRPRERWKPRPRRRAASASWRCWRRAPGWVRCRRRRLHRRLRRRHRR
jgi:hypothetical protein